MDTAGSVINSPLVVALVSVAATALVMLAVAAVKVIVLLAKMASEITQIHTTLTEMKTDPDVMRWSNYGRAAQAFQQAQIPQGNQS